MDKIIGIIGGAGNYGRFLRQLFSQAGYEVVWSDLGTLTSNTNVVQKANVVIFTTPVKETPTIISSLAPNFKPDQLVCDVASLKSQSVSVMLESHASVIGIHPLCAPKSLMGQPVVVCPARPGDWLDWLLDILTTAGARVIQLEPAEHDRLMLAVQIVPHLSVALATIAWRELGIDAATIQSLASPFCQAVFLNACRLHGMPLDMVAGIQIGNNQAEELWRVLDLVIKRLDNIISAGDTQTLINELVQNREFLGQATVDQGFKRFGDLSQQFAP